MNVSSYSVADQIDLVLERAKGFFWFLQIDRDLYPFCAELPTLESIGENLLKRKVTFPKEFYEQYLWPALEAVKRLMLAKDHENTTWPYCSFNYENKIVSLQGFRL